jgi:hypothetical protein
VYATSEKNKTGEPIRYSVGLRVSESCMKRLRWIIGDHVAADFDNEAMTWTLRRVSDQQGNCLSGQGKNGGSGTVRFAVDESELQTLGLSLGQGYDGSLKSEDQGAAVFAIE